MLSENIVAAGYADYAAAPAYNRAPVVSYSAPPPTDHGAPIPGAGAMDSWLLDGVTTGSALSSTAYPGGVLDSAVAAQPAVAFHGLLPAAGIELHRGTTLNGDGLDHSPAYEPADGTHSANALSLGQVTVAAAAAAEAERATDHSWSAAAEQPSTPALSDSRQAGSTEDYGAYDARLTHGQLGDAWGLEGASAAAAAGRDAGQYGSGSMGEADAVAAAGLAPAAEGQGLAGSEGAAGGTEIWAESVPAASEHEGDDVSLLSDMASSVDQDEAQDEAELQEGASSAAFVQESEHRDGSAGQSREAPTSAAMGSLGGIGGDHSAITDTSVEQLAMTPTEAASAAASSAPEDDNDGGGVCVDGTAVTAADSGWAAPLAGEAALDAGGLHARQASSISLGAPTYNR